MVANPRARSGADKLARRMQILDAALELWEERGYDAVTMSQVADRLQLAKGTLYLYFKTKEELFLAVYIHLLDEWFNKAEAAIQELSPARPLGVSKALVSLLVARPNLARLLPIVSTVLERNISASTGREYREWLRDRISRLAAHLDAKLDGTPPGTGNDALVYFFALAASLQPASEPTDAMRPIVEDSSMVALKVDFGPALQHGFATLLLGFQRLAK